MSDVKQRLSAEPNNMY